MQQPDPSSPSARSLAAIALAVGYLPNLTQLWYPLGGDHCVYAWAGRHILDGQWPYVHFVIQNLPGPALPFALLGAVAGPEALWYRAFDWCAQVAAGLLIFRLARRLAGPWAAFAAMTLYGLRYGVLNFHTAGNADATLTLPYVAGIALLLKATTRSEQTTASGESGRHGGRGGWLVAAGLVSSLTLFIKITHGLWWPVAVLWLIWTGRRRGRTFPAILRSIGLFAAGCVAPLAVFVGAYALAGHFDALIECLVRYNLAYGGMRRPFHLNFLFFPQGPVHWTVLALLGAWGLVWTLADTRRPRERATAVLAGLWGLAAAAGAAAQGKWFGYHLVALTGPTSLWAGIGIAVVAGDLAARSAGNVPAHSPPSALRSLSPRAAWAVVILALAGLYLVPAVRAVLQHHWESALESGWRIVAGIAVFVVARRFGGVWTAIAAAVIWCLFCWFVPRPLAGAIFLAMGGPIWPAVGTRALWARISSAGSPVAVRLGPLVPALLAGVWLLGGRAATTPATADWTAAVRYLTGRMDESRMIEHFSSRRFVDAHRAAEFIRRHSNPGDGILSLCKDPAVLYLSGRRSVTRFIIPHCIYPYRDSPEAHEPNSLWSRRQAEFVDAVRNDRPRFVVSGPKEVLDNWDPSIREIFQSLFRVPPQIARMLKQDYRLVRRFGGYQVYQRVGP